MALNFNIKNEIRELDRKTSSTELAVRKSNKYVDIKLDLMQSKVGNPLYFDQSMVNDVYIAIATDEEAVIEYLKNLFTCAPGDLYLYPNFGLNLKKYTFEPITDRVASEIGHYIKNSIDDLSDASTKGPLVRLVKVSIYPNIEASQFELTIIFQVRMLSKEITLFGTISTQDGVYFFNK